MLDRADLKGVLNSPDLSRQDCLLLCLACDGAQPKQVKSVKSLALESGVSEAKRWNISDVLKRSKGLAFRTSAGWELTEKGKQHIAPLIQVGKGGPTIGVAITLRQHIQSIGNVDVASFVEEAVRCMEASCFRAAVVLSWAGAVAVLREYVLQGNLAAFNTEAKRRNAKQKLVTSYDDFEGMKEYDFLQVLGSISILGRSVKLELEARLKFRNACGHPTTLLLSEHMVSAHVESLILNVYSRFT